MFSTHQSFQRILFSASVCVSNPFPIYLLENYLISTEFNIEFCVRIHYGSGSLVTITYRHVHARNIRIDFECKHRR